MKQNHYPNHIQARLDTFERQVAHLTQQVSRTQAAITSARERLGGGFEKDQEYYDMRATLDQMVKDLPALESKLRDAEYTLTDAKAWLDQLPDDAALEVVKSVPPNGFNLDHVRNRIENAEDEIKRLRAVPTPPPDIKARVEAYVATLARPKVTGISQQLRVSWPNDTAALLAFLRPDEMVAALMREIDRLANLPMPLPQRKRRIVELQAEIDTLQRQALALGAGTSGLPPAVVLGVRIAEAKSSRAA